MSVYHNYRINMCLPKVYYLLITINIKVYDNICRLYIYYNKYRFKKRYRLILNILNSIQTPDKQDVKY